ncbi:hypothetical protein J3458_015476 [Metarhizium acridum]|uniref:uncharacterized protein n=1 Tax=Metarhizium acridum TaxID=92637 RepID=UPI001C6B408B|nr:hypothetical protein J3458_015476 [Metarhizium acridum]
MQYADQTNIRDFIEEHGSLLQQHVEVTLRLGLMSRRPEILNLLETLCSPLTIHLTNQPGHQRRARACSLCFIAMQVDRNRNFSYAAPRCTLLASGMGNMAGWHSI